MLASVALLEVWWAYLHDFQMAWMYEFSSYAEIARSLTEGRYQTLCVYPAELAVLENVGHPDPPWPVTYRFPLFVLWVAGFFKVFGANDAAMVMAGAALWALFVVAIYLVGRRLFPEPGPTAALAAGLALTTPLFFRVFTLWGYTCFLFGLLLLLHHYQVTQSSTLGGAALAGVLGGLSYLARFNFILFVPVTCGFLLWRRQSKLALAYLGGFLPIFIGYSVTRPPGASQLQALTLVGNLQHLGAKVPWLDYVAPPSALSVLSQNSGALANKALFNLFQQIEWFFVQFGHYFWVPLACVGGYRLLSEGKQDRLKFWLQLYLGHALVQLLVFSLLRVETLGRYWVWLSPCVLLLAARTYLLLLGDLAAGTRRLVLGVSLVIGLLWFVGQMRYSVQPGIVPQWGNAPPTRLELPRLAQSLPEDALVITNVAVHVSWYCRRACVDLPNTVEEVETLLERHKVAALYVASWPQGELYNRPQWAALVGQPNWTEDLRQRLGAKRVDVLRDSVVFWFGDVE